MKVSSRKLTEIASVLCGHLEECGYEEIELPVPLYWEIPKEYEYDPYNEPSEHTLGNLEDDWEQLEQMLKEPDRVVGHGLVWLAAVLRAVGQNVAC